MADNVAITAGVGTAVAADDVGSVFYQKIKLDLGTDGASAPALAGAGVVATGVQRMTLASDDPAVVDLAAIEVLLGTMDTDTGNMVTALQLLDNAVDGNYLNVNLNVAGTDAAAGEGVISAQTQRVTLATDDDGVAHLATIAGDTTSLDTKVTACDTGAVVLTTGSAAIGKLAANTGVDIGDVDVTSIVPGTAATNLGKARDVACGANDVGVMALAVRDDALTTLTPVDGDYVPLRVSSTGALHVTGGGGGTEYTEDVATPAAITGTATMMERDDIIAALTPVAGDWAAMRCSAEGALWVQDFNSDAALVLLGTIDTDTGKIVTAVESLDNAVDGNFLNVNLNLAGTDAGVGESALDGTELRVTLATDDDAVAHLSTIAGAVSTQMQCDIVAALPAGDNNIGNVDIVGGTVTTVSTVTNQSQMSGTAISMNEGVLEAGVQRVTLATDDDGVAHLATIAADTNNIETAVQIIDDWDATHDSAASADGPQVMAAYDSTKPAAVGDGDAVRVLADSYGRLLSGVEPTRFQATFDSADATGEAEVVHASAASTVIVVQSFVISSDVEGWIKLQDEDSTALTGKFWLKAGGGVAITLPTNAPIVLGADKDLEVICEAAGNVSVSVTGYTIPG